MRRAHPPIGKNIYALAFLHCLLECQFWYKQFHSSFVRRTRHSHWERFSYFFIKANRKERNGSVESVFVRSLVLLSEAEEKKNRKRKDSFFTFRRVALKEQIRVRIIDKLKYYRNPVIRIQSSRPKMTDLLKILSKTHWNSVRYDFLIITSILFSLMGK